MKNLSVKRSRDCFDQAREFIPGGVNSPVRAFKAVGMGPLFIKKASGAYIYDVDNNKYLDYVLSWGPMILGHADKTVIKAVKRALERGSSFGAPTEGEIELARLINKIYPSIELVRLVSSGTEGAMSALRLARGYTGREKIIKFQGCYHGHFDSLLVEAGSGSSTFGVPSSSGVNKSLTQDTISLPFNDINRVKEAVRQHKDSIACVIVEPIAANMGVILPEKGFLEELRKITRENNIVLIFDEVITGFRVALGGAQELFGVKPDLTILGKILGGGFPVGAFGGKREIMNLLSPEGPVYQGGTLSGNPVAVQAGITTIKLLIKNKIYDSLNELTLNLELGLKEVIRKKGVQATIQRAGSLFTLFFTDKQILKNYDDVRACNLPKFAGFFRNMLKQGIYLAASQFEANFVSVKHTYGDVKNTLKAAESALGELKG